MRKLKITEMNRLNVEDFKESAKMPLVVVLDNVRRLYNVGSVFRTCDAFRVERLCLCGITAQPPHTENNKTALAAEESADWLYFKDTLACVKWLKDEGYTVMSIEQCEGSTLLQDFRGEVGQRYAVVRGNEVKGVQQAVIDESDGCLEIPQFGTKHSMNVSVTTGMVIWEVAKQMMLC